MAVDKEILPLDNGKEGGADWGVLASGSKSKELGKFVCVTPHSTLGSNQYLSINFTGPPGSASALYDSLFFWMLKQDWNVEKLDEDIEVSPTHAQYYQLTLAQKQALEGTIKTGLASAAQAVADFELINHDLRKYKEILDYFTHKDEHSLKAMFIDQVDIHTGEGVSMRSIVGRWPTIIHDFMRVKEEKDLDAKKLGVSQAEVVILKTKFRLYQEWKTLFGQAAKERYERLKGLVESRKRTIEEYRKWLKPYITRFKMMKLGHETEAGRLGTLRAFHDLAGQASFSNNIKIWAWKPFRPPEAKKATTKITEKFLIHPYDRYVRENFILSPTGLAKIYPWLRNKIDAGKAKQLDIVNKGIVREEEATVADEMVDNILKSEWNLEKKLDPTRLYYVFMTFDISRVGKRVVDFEFEDITFDIKTHLLSQNIMLTKYLELKCREKEFEKDIDIILGIKAEEGEITELVKKDYPELFGVKEEKKPPTIITEFSSAIVGMRNALKSFINLFSSVSKIFSGFVKPGPYESSFSERITAYYLMPMGKDYFGSVVGFLKSKMGIE